MEGITNFRDFGIYGVRDGRQLRRGRLFRSAHHHEATAADLDVLSRLGVGLIVDLRKPGERSRQPSVRWQGCRALILERSDSTSEIEPPHLQFLTTPGLTPATVRQRMMDLYREFPFDPGQVDIFRRYFAALAATEGAVIVHCTAGKDRTGLLVAMTHHLLGASRDDLVTDYLATNLHGRIEERLPGVLRTFEENHGQSVLPDILREVMTVHVDALEAAFDAIAENCGSLEAYLERHLGVSDGLRRALELRLLE